MNSNPGQKVQTSAPFHKVRSRSRNVLLWGFIVGLLGLVWGVATLNASTFVSATAATEGDGLRIDFVERGLQPGQNYDYVGSFGSATETFQCYHPRTFTPTGRTFEIDS